LARVNKIRYTSRQGEAVRQRNVRLSSTVSKPNQNMKKSILFFMCSFILMNANAQQVENKSSLTIPQIMQSERFIGYSPSRIQWSGDNETIYFSWNPEMEKLRSTYKINIESGNPEKVSNEELISMPSAYASYSKDRKSKVYAKNGDIFIYNVETQRAIQVTNTIELESNPRFYNGDPKAVYELTADIKIVYQKSGNLYVWNRIDGTTRQITNFKKGTKAKDKKRLPNEEWLYNDQADFEIVQNRKDISQQRKEQREALKPKRPFAIYYGTKSVSNIRLSPNMKFVTYRLTTKAKAKKTHVPSFVTESGYMKDLPSRPKVGSPQNTYEMGVYDIDKDTAYIIDIKQMEGIYDKAAFLKEYHTGDEAYNPKYKKPRSVIYHGAKFSDDSKAVIEIKALDNKDRWLMLVDLPTGKLTQLDRQHDDAWIGGPGVVGWNVVSGNTGWISNDLFYYQSEKTGYSHLYCVNVNTGKTKQLTKGDFEILSADLSNDKKHFYITSNKKSPFEHHFYKMKVDGGKMEQITSMTGKNDVSLSPDESQIAIRYSYSNKPWELYIMKNEAGAKAKQLTKSTTKAFKAYDWRDPEIVYFTASDGVKVPARLYRPQNAKPNAPAVIFVHGAGYLQNVHRGWSGYHREYMFHNILVDNGYTVLDIDYRASAGYGRDWRTSIYRHMGSKDLSDQIDGAKYLVDNFQVDKDNIGIYGGSYGGFITMMGLFNHPGTFKSGAALRSVTDWAHYNHEYTNNILNTPVQDSIAYRRSSPIHFAEGLQDNLLILHGMIDTNVQFQDVVRLSQRLIELEKDNWEFSVFPMESHGFVEPSSWTDEYKRIFKLFQTTLK
jgi:dipeptidyl aminopeptidase/acylaminoacyl peptidase